MAFNCVLMFTGKCRPHQLSIPYDSNWEGLFVVYLVFDFHFISLTYSWVISNHALYVVSFSVLCMNGPPPPCFLPLYAGYCYLSMLLCQCIHFIIIKFMILFYKIYDFIINYYLLVILMFPCFTYLLSIVTLCLILRWLPLLHCFSLTNLCHNLPSICIKILASP